MTTQLSSNNGFIFNPKKNEKTNEEIFTCIRELNYKYEQQNNELKIQIDKLTNLVSDLQKINIRVDDKTTDIANGIQQIIENT